MKKKIIFDIGFNIIATAFPLIILQLIIYPYLGKILGQDGFGILLSLVSIAMFTSQPFGNVLNNVRLIKEEEYKCNKIEGDFITILLIMLFINSIVVIIGVYITVKVISVISLLLIIIYSSLNLINEYTLVGFRLKLNYKFILISNIILSFGYLIGLLFFSITKEWAIIYIFGLMLTILFASKKTKILSEPSKKTFKFKETGKTTIVLFSSTFLKSSITHIDRFILLVIFGASTVSIYYSASFIGKIISLAITPISGVMLSYFRTIDKINNRTFLKMLISLIIVGSIGYIILLIAGPFILELLYPDWAKQSIQILPITIAISIVTTLSTFLHPLILRYKHINWQMFISLFYFISNILFAFIFSIFFGLKGFAIGILVSRILIVIVMSSIFIFAKSNFIIQK